MRESLQRYGTVTFSREIMRDLIKFGVPVQLDDGTWVIKRELDSSNLCLDLWLLSVPDVYREQVVEIAMEAAKRQVGQKATQRLIDHVISVILSEIWEKVEPDRNLAYEV